MKRIASVDIGSFVLYGAVLVAFWTFIFGLYYWLLGWMFGAQAWYIDMNLLNWTTYTISTLLSVLWRFDGIAGRQPARGTGDLAERFRDERERFGRVELSRKESHGVVRLIVPLIEGLQFVEGDVLDVAARAGRLFPIVMPFVCSSPNSLFQNSARLVL